MTLLRIVKTEDPWPGQKCRLKLAHQYGRGSNRRAVYVCQAHPRNWHAGSGCCNVVSFKGFSTKRKAARP